MPPPLKRRGFFILLEDTIYTEEGAPRDRAYLLLHSIYLYINMYHLLLEYLIKSLVLEEGEPEYTKLKVTSFHDREVRVDTLIQKLIKGDPLTLQKGSSPVIIKQVIITRKGADPEHPLVDVFTSDNFADLKQVLPSLKAYDKLVFVDTKDNKYPVTAFAKTPELGGLGVGGTLKPERLTIGGLNNQIQQLGGSIDIKFNDVVYRNITNVVNVPENRKADFAFASRGKQVLFISYKPGNSPKSFHHYGGVSYIQSPTVDSFVEAVRRLTPEMSKSGLEYGILLDKTADSDLILKALYGLDYGSGTFGLNNVQGLVQGSNVSLAKSDKGYYEIVASHIIVQPTIPTGDYAPVLTASYAGDRNQGGIKNCRLRVIPAKARGTLINPFTKKPI